MAQLINNSDPRLVELERIQQERQEQFICARDVWSKYYNQKKLVVVHAEEKSGKRDITKGIALIDFKIQAKPFHEIDDQYLIPHENARSKHIYIVGLNRNDIKPQLEELNKFNITAYIVTSKKDAENIINELKKVSYPRIVFHLDECDYAAGSKQSLSPIINMIAYDEKTFGVFYSATPEELTKSNFQDNPGIELDIIQFQPHSNYRGAKWFLDNNLCNNAEEFFEAPGVLSEQGRECIALLHERICQKTGRNIGVVRLAATNAYNEFSKWHDAELALLKNSRTAFYAKHMYLPKFVDKNRPFGWDMWEETEFHNNYAHIIFINQTCTRSTEITNNGHSRIAFWHDERQLDANACYNTLSQAYGRVKHYDNIGHPIMVYGDPNVFKLSCGEMAWLEFGGKVAQRVITTARAGNVIDETAIEIVLRQFDTFDEANKFTNGRLKNDKLTFDDAGRVLSSITNKKEVITEQKLKTAIANFKGTAGFCVGKMQALKPGDKLFRKYIGYNAAGELKYWVRCLTNISTMELKIKSADFHTTNTHTATKKSAYHKL